MEQCTMNDEDEDKGMPCKFCREDIFSLDAYITYENYIPPPDIYDIVYNHPITVELCVSCYLTSTTEGNALLKELIALSRLTRYND